MTDVAVHILLVEDNAADAVLFRTELAESPFGPFSITHVQRLSEALSQLREQRFDAVLLDLNLPDSQGLATLGQIGSAAGETISRLRGVLDQAGIADDRIVSPPGAAGGVGGPSSIS